MRRKYNPETLSQYKYPNLVAEFMESGYSICTLSEYMGLGRRKENDTLMNAKIFGTEDIMYLEAVGLMRLFRCDLEYLFSENLEIFGDMPAAYYRHYESNKQMEREMELFRISENVSEALKEKPYLADFMKYVLTLDEQQIKLVMEISKSLEAA